MSEWNRMRKQNRNLESMILIIIAACFLLGGWCDWNALVKEKAWIFINDIDAFSLTILQIQASTATLIIARIALITGNISDSYMGVSVSDFYLNIKPWKLKQKMLIFMLLGFELIGALFHVLKLYNCVFGVFVATLAVILLSILEMYSAFEGRNKQNQDIEAYINYVLDSDTKIDCKLDVYQKFVLDWKRELDSQDKQSYEKYYEIFKRCMLVLWDCGMDKCMSAIEQQSYNMAYSLLGSEKVLVKERGIEFIQDVYDILWGCIYKCNVKNQGFSGKYRKEFSLFSQIGADLMQNMDELSIESVERRMMFGHFTDTVQRVALWLGNKEENKDCENETKNKRLEYKFSSEIIELNSFARYVGYYLGKQQNKNNTVNYRLWSVDLKYRNLFSAYNIPEERQEIYLKSKLSIYFGYCYGMLVNGQEEVVKQGLYLQGMKQVLTSNKYQFLLYLTVHCYVYYLAVRENDDCVTEKIRHSARNIWEDPKIKDAFLDYLNILAENSQWINLDILRQMENVMNGYELFSQNGTSKVMMIESVISEFYIFFVVFMSCEFNLPELLERNVDDSRMIWYVSKSNEKTTKEMFTELFKMIYMENKVDEQIEAEVNLMYDSFEKAVKKKHKERRLRSAMESQANYETNEEEIGKKIQRDIAHRLRERFAPILVENDDTDDVIIIDLLNISDYTDLVGKRSIAGYYFDIDGAFLRGIERFLLNKKALETKNRFKDFENDKEFMEYLSANNQYLLFGSQLILKNSNYKNRAEFNEFLDKCKTIYTVGELNGIALKEDSIQVCLHEVKVSICSPSIEEENVNYNEQTGKYYYSIINGLPVEFEKDELIEFLYNERKVIKVTAKVSIQVNEIPVGTVFTGRSVHE